MTRMFYDSDRLKKKNYLRNDFFPTSFAKVIENIRDVFNEGRVLRVLS